MRAPEAGTDEASGGRLRPAPEAGTDEASGGRLRPALVLLVLAACGDNVAVFDASNQGDAPPNVGSLFGEPCAQAPFPQIALCHDGLGACNDEDGGSVCRPFCVYQGFEQCAALGGMTVTTDRGACLCVPM